MYEVLKTEEFDEWLKALDDQRAVARIVTRIERLGQGNPGDVRAVGEGVSEIRIQYGPGYRVYYKQTGKTIVLILCGGDKASQDRDIKRAKDIAAEL
ncbi:type II toxin-antitoxin system RelE/ParE family toxin [soil metagenome]